MEYSSIDAMALTTPSKMITFMPIFWAILPKVRLNPVVARLPIVTVSINAVLVKSVLSFKMNGKYNWFVFQTKPMNMRFIKIAQNNIIHA